MPLESLQEIENLDDRREIYRLIQLLPALDRLNFLQWSADNSLTFTADGQRVIFVVTPDTDFTNPDVVYWDLMQLIAVHGITVQKMLRELERRASRVLLPVGRT